MTAAVFVTGTDTGVGKTVVAAALTLAMDAFYWKPVQTGDQEGADADFVCENALVAKARIVPSAHSYRAPLSPHLAAALENRHIALSDFTLPTVRPLVVEGAGGVLVPLNDEHLMVHLIQALHLPVLVVARSTLGTINHTLLTLEALRSRGVTVAGVVMNGPVNIDNKMALEKYGRIFVVAEIPHFDKIDADVLLEIGKRILNGMLEAR
jgi:malonyl-CoA O-methyltransferase